MRQYLDLLQYILESGVEKNDRTGVGTKSVFGCQMRFDLSQGFPLLTTKRLHLKSIIHELIMFLRGETNIKYLNDHGVTIWDEWADENGELGPIYGHQWRQWPSWTKQTSIDPATKSSMIEMVNKPIDQIVEVVEKIKTNPDDRRLIVTAWNPADIPKMALPPCHCLFQFYVANNKLSCQMYQRSCDVFLGVPFNIASYSLLVMMVARVCKLQLGEFIWTGGDTHLYLNHLDQARLQLTREPRSLPRMFIKNRGQSLFEFEYEDFTLYGYNPHPLIPAEIAV